MKKLLLVFVLSLAVSHGYSQFGLGFGMGGLGMHIPLGNGNNGAQRSRNIEKQVQQMKSDLNLNDDQVIKLRSLLVEQDRRRRGTDPMEGKEYNQHLQQFLTPERYAKLIELRKQKQQQKQTPKQQQPPPDNGDNKDSHTDDWDN